MSELRMRPLLGGGHILLVILPELPVKMHECGSLAERDLSRWRIAERRMKSLLLRQSHVLLHHRKKSGLLYHTPLLRQSQFRPSQPRRTIQPRLYQL
jgi:hypothetical protein